MPWLNTWMRRAPVSSQRVDRRHIHLLDGFGKQPAEHPDRMHAERQAARKRAEPDCGDEEQRPDQVGNGARKADDRPRAVIGVTRRRHVGGGEQRERHREHDPDHGAEQRDVDGLERRPDRRRQLGEIRRHGAADDVGHAVDAGDKVLRPRLDDDEGLDHHARAPAARRRSGSRWRPRRPAIRRRGSCWSRERTTPMVMPPR